MAVSAHLNVPYLPVAQIDHLVAVHQRLGVFEQKLQHAGLRGAVCLDGRQRVAPDEPAGLVEFDGKAQPRLDRVVGIVHVDPKIAIGFLKPQRIQRLHAGIPYPQIAARLHDQVVGLHGLGCRNMQFPSELAHEGHTIGECDGIAHVDLPRGHEGKPFIRQIGARDTLQQRPRFRPVHIDLAAPRRHVGDHGDLAVAQMAAHPHLRMTSGVLADDHHEFVWSQPGHRQVRLEPATAIDPCGIDDAACHDVHVVAGQARHQRQRIRPLDLKAGHRGHIHHDHVLARRPVFLGVPVEPGLTKPGVCVDLRLFRGRGEPVRLLPPVPFGEKGPGSLQSVMQNRPLHIARGLEAFVGVVLAE